MLGIQLDKLNTRSQTIVLASACALALSYSKASYSQAPYSQEPYSHASSVQAQAGDAESAASDSVSASTSTMILDMRTTPDMAPAPAAEESPLIREYETAIESVEGEYGAYAPSLTEQLLGLGSVLQQENRHAEAANVFKRGVHLARINGGLYNGEQIQLLRGEIRSRRALGQYDDVDNRQRYLYRVERRALRHSEESAYALLDQAEWQREAYIQAVGGEENRIGRLRMMWDLYHQSLTEMISYFGDQSLELRKPLVGMIKAQYLIAGYQQYMPGKPTTAADSPYVQMTDAAFRKGESVLTALFELSVVNQAPPLQTVKEKLALADWAWWFGKRSEAEIYYAEASRYAIESKDTLAGAFLEDALRQPQPLPTIDGMEPIPAPYWDDRGALVVSFSISDTGRVMDLERVGEPEVEKEEAKDINRLLRALRRTRFRPMFTDGLPVASETIIWSWSPSAWSPQPLELTRIN